MLMMTEIIENYTTDVYHKEIGGTETAIELLYGTATPPDGEGVPLGDAELEGASDTDGPLKA
jgi:hypothetical protein